jgi:hypothetical protein
MRAAGQRRNSLTKHLGGAPDTATVLRVFVNSAKGADARPRTAKEPGGSHSSNPLKLIASPMVVSPH